MCVCVNVCACAYVFTHMCSSLFPNVRCPESLKPGHLTEESARKHSFGQCYTQDIRAHLSFILRGCQSLLPEELKCYGCPKHSEDE